MGIGAPDVEPARGIDAARQVSPRLTKYGVVFTAIVPLPVAAILPWGISRWHLQPAFLGIEPLRWVGAALIPAGVVLYWAALTCLERQDARAYPPCKKIVSCDVYGRVRNPMYGAVLLMLGGQALLFASRGLVLYTAGWFLAFHVLEVTFDEPFLAKKFGDDYRRYHAAVPRWVPRWQRRRTDPAGAGDAIRRERPGARPS